MLFELVAGRAIGLLAEPLAGNCFGKKTSEALTSAKQQRLHTNRLTGVARVIQNLFAT
jgi:hypothetical protein